MNSGRPALLRGREDHTPNISPHLSYSRINRYSHCPEQYRLYYIENLRPKVPPANLVFGQTIHQALAAMFREGQDPVVFFKEAWTRVQADAVRYGSRQTWESLDTCGQALLRTFLSEELDRIDHVKAVEKDFEIGVTGFDVPFVGIIDLVASVDGKRTVVDFKTSSSRYGAHEVELSDQLTQYELVAPDAEQVALCVFVKTKKPQIEWHFREGSGAQLLEYLRKAKLIAHEIEHERFYKRSGRWCAWCDFLPVCMGDTKRAEEQLVRIERS